MPLSSVPASTQSDGRYLIIYLPSTASNPLSLAILTGGTAKDLTYSFTPDGWNISGSQDSVDDKRLTLAQNFSRPGRFTESGNVKYVVSSGANDAKSVLGPVTNSINGPAGYLVVRKGVDNATALATGQKVDVYTLQFGVPLPDAPSENGLDTITQQVYVTAVTQRDQTIVA